MRGFDRLHLRNFRLGRLKRRPEIITLEEEG
jgi:hypothetical protein